MPFVFDTVLFPDVRAAIGLDVDESMLPDTVLALPVYKEETERFIERNLTEAQYTDPQYVDDVEYIAVMYLASLVVPSLRMVESERGPGFNVTYAKTDLTALAARLLAAANARIGDIITTPGDTIAENLNFFGKARRKVF